MGKLDIRRMGKLEKMAMVRLEKVVKLEKVRKGTLEKVRVDRWKKGFPVLDLHAQAWPPKSALGVGWSTIVRGKLHCRKEMMQCTID